MKYRRRHRDPLVQLTHQKLRIEQFFSFITCKVSRARKCLVCTGQFWPHKECDRYEVEIIYKLGSPPKVFILSPEIRYSPKIHMYSDTSLCLYYPRDMPWTDQIVIADTIIPWIGEWIVFYELYKLTGRWKGPKAPHLPLWRM